MFKALVSFAGLVTMAQGEVRDIPEKYVNDLLNAGYIEDITPEVKVENKPKPRKKSKK